MSKVRHLIQIMRHKWYVFIAGWRLKVPLWRLLTHDLSKFSPAEFGAYARQFHGDKGDPTGFAHAWLHHQHHNAHHWEYWIGSNGVPIKDVPKYTLVPRGMTALLDAVGRAINEAGCRLAAIPEDQRPGLVVFVIVTDGQENSSHEFTRAQIKEMIERQQSVYSWQFTFLGANQDAFAEAGSLGISPAAAANYVPTNSKIAFSSAANNVTRMRKMSAEGQSVVCGYTNDERTSME